MANAKKHVSTGFGEIAYSECGTGPVSLFVHGIFHNGYLWRDVVRRLQDLRRCIAVDLMAHGDTIISADQDLSFAAQAEMLDSFCAALDIAQVDLVANDSGAGIAQIFAARHPTRIRSMVLTNGDVHDNWPPPSFERIRTAAAQGLLGPALEKMLSDIHFARTSFAPGYEHPEHLAPEMFRASLAPLVASEQRARDFARFVGAMNCRDTVAIEPLLRKLQAPTLVVWGTADIFFPVKWAYWLKETIPGTRKVIEIEGAKLFFPEERPAEFADAIRAHWSES
jgi:pimeloyl-ACP methyl ester carboxylesterase